MITTPLTTNIVEGISELEPTARGVRPHRLPSWVRQNSSPRINFYRWKCSPLALAFA